MITVSGTATQQSTSGSTAASGVLVEIYDNSAPNTVVTMATTDGSGNFSLTVPTNGAPVDGFLKATKSGNADTYLYPPAPLAADFTMAAVNELDTNTYGLLAQTIGRGQAGQGMIALEVFDTSNTKVAGATVSSTPAAVKTGYTSGSLPSTTATSTAADGRGYLFGLSPGSVTVSAQKTGDTFMSHSVTVFANALTTTVVTE